MKYTGKAAASDGLSGLINGSTFGFIFAFYNHPFDFAKADIKSKYKGSTLRYYGSWTWRMAVGFSVLRVSYNAISAQELGIYSEITAIGATTLLITKLLF